MHGDARGYKAALDVGGAAKFDAFFGRHGASDTTEDSYGLRDDPAIHFSVRADCNTVIRKIDGALNSAVDDHILPGM